MLTKVISGGQTGVDQAALRAAKECGLQTGGYAPLGFRTLEGPNPALLRDVYGLEETGLTNYAQRTERNVIESDATLRIAREFQSPGEQCTLQFLVAHGKLFLDVSAYRAAVDRGHIVRVVDWLEKRNIRTLNVAGNSESTAPGIYQATVPFLMAVFQQYLLRNKD